jgi:3-dehydroquinate synthase
MDIQHIEIETEGHHSSIHIGESVKNFANYIPANKTIIITDTNIFAHYGQLFEAYPVIVIGTGEGQKNLQTIDTILDKMISFEADRSWFVLGVGGGVVCDMAGFAASIFMRGIRFGFVSTTLLSQVDASVGGKNGVNHHGLKNMIGTFNQPDFVICDHTMLATLDKREFIGGFAEIIKHGAIKSISHFVDVEKNIEAALNGNDEVIHKLVSDSVKIKAGVVSRDEKEQGERRTLNFGHTLGHSIEKLTGVHHGEAVAIGMVLEAKISVRKGYLTTEEADRLILLIKNMGLPVVSPIALPELIKTMRHDKKREGNSIHFVFLKALGNATHEKITFDELEELVYDLC